MCVLYGISNNINIDRVDTCVSQAILTWERVMGKNHFLQYSWD